MGKLVNLIAVLGLLGMMVLSLIDTTPVLADRGRYLDPVTIEREHLQGNQERITPNVVVTKIGSTNSTNTYRADISILPETMPDLETEIICEWRAGRDLDGVVYATTGNNLFWSRVTGTRVSVEYEGRQAAWDPTLMLGDTEVTYKSGPYIVNDPINPNYVNNSIKWTYTCKRGGFLGIGSHTYTITRYLRQIEGALLEYYVVENNPGADLVITQNYEEENQFSWDRPVAAWDSEGNIVPVTYSGGKKTVTAEDFKKARFPVYIDPSLSFSTSASDGMLYNGGSTWSAARIASSSSWGSSSYPFLYVLSAGDGSWYDVGRSYLYFDTSSIGTGSTVTSSILKLFEYSESAVENPEYLTLYVSGGMPTYPHDPLVYGDFYYSYYSGDYGHLAMASIVENTYNSIDLTSTGLSAIDVDGITKFVLRTSQDYSNVQPNNYNEVFFCSYELGSGYAPKLEVTYTAAVVTPTVTTTASTAQYSTSSTLGGTLSYDGGAACSVRFDYGTTTGYGFTTGWQSSKVTGNTFSDTAYGLVQGTLYHFRAEAQNTAGTGYGSDLTLLTRPDYPTGFTVTPGDTNNSLAWTLGTGSTKTLVRYKTTGYPTSTSDGTQVYFSTGNSVVHSSLTNGVTYYYSIWAYAESGGLNQYSTYYSTGSGTPYLLSIPVVTTYAATNIGSETANLNGYLNSLQGDTYADCWFQYYSGAGTWTDHETTPDTKASTGSVTTSISSLDVSTKYYFRIAGVNDQGTAYGASMNFTTGGPSAPSMTTQTATAVTMTSAVLNGKVTNDGGVTVTGWFEYGLADTYGFTTGSASALETDDTLYVTLSNLSPSTTYHFRVVGQNTAGIGYGSDTTFNTSAPGAANCSTLSATGTGSTSTTLHGLVTADGGVDCDVRFQYGVATGVYDTDTGWMSGYRNGESFQMPISGLSEATTYYYRTQIKNSVGTVNGSELTVLTQFGPPESFKAEATSSTSIKLSWEETGDQTGVFVKEGSFPVDRLDGDVAYFGPSESTSNGNLVSGVTYFYRAWSWSEGGNWSTTYAEDAATTSLYTSESDIVTYGPSTNLSEPDEYFQSPNGSTLSGWPGYELIETAATESGIPSGSIWLIITLTICSLIGIVTYLVTSNLIFVIVAMGVGIIVGSIIGTVPLWILIAYICLGIGGGYLAKQSS